MSKLDVEIGSRVSVDSVFRGTVKFVGEIDGVKGTWLGVDWDAAERGKHDGTHAGHIYFTTTTSTSGSFVRPEKVCHGYDLLHEVAARYDDSQTYIEYSIGSKQIELVGMQMVSDKQRKFAKLRHVVLDFMNVSKCGCETAVSDCLSRCELLDLAGNLLSDWNEIVKIVGALPKLKTLNLSRNRIRPCVDVKQTLTVTLLSALILNDIDYDWLQAHAAISQFTGLQTLCLCRNRIAVIPATTITVDCMQSLRSIDLEENCITEWAHIQPLALLPLLESLNLARNTFTCITFDDVQNPFPNLNELILRGCRVEEWSSIDQLSHLPKLAKLVLHGNPVMNTYAFETSRQIVIARMSLLTMLDRQVIDLQERRGAEIDYVKRFGREWLPAKDNPEQLLAFNALHPHYERLCKVYGEPDQAEVDGVHKTGVLKDRLIKIEFVCDKLAKPINKGVPALMTVGKLRVLAARLCRIPTHSVVMDYAPIKQTEHMIPLDNDLRQLQYFCMENGDKIHVSMAQ